MTIVTAEALLSRLQGLAKPGQRDGMARFGIDSSQALGISMPDIRLVAKGVKSDQALAETLWSSGVHEARTLATIIADPEQIEAESADRWASDFNSWDLCDQACINLMHRTPFAWDKVRQWTADDRQFVRRAGFALIAVKALHDKGAPDTVFLPCLDLIERHAGDGRNFVKKAVNWALRQIGKRNPTMNQAAISCADRLVLRPEPSARWIGRDALRELTSTKVAARIGLASPNVR